MLALETLGDHALNVRQPQSRVTGHRRGAGVTPAVAVDLTFSGDQYGRPGGVGDAHQRLGAFALAVLIE